MSVVGTFDLAGGGGGGGGLPKNKSSGFIYLETTLPGDTRVLEYFSCGAV